MSLSYQIVMHPFIGERPLTTTDSKIKRLRDGTVRTTRQIQRGPACSPCKVYTPESIRKINALIAARGVTATEAIELLERDLATVTVDAPAKPKRGRRKRKGGCVAKDPFMGKSGYGAVSVEDRLHKVKNFSKAQCEAALKMDHLQKTVRQSIERRLRKLLSGGVA